MNRMESGLEQKLHQCVLKFSCGSSVFPPTGLTGKVTVHELNIGSKWHTHTIYRTVVTTTYSNIVHFSFFYQLPVFLQV